MLNSFQLVASVYGATATWMTLSTSHKVDRVEFNSVASVYRAYDITTLLSPKLRLWLRTALCGGCCRLMLCNLEVHGKNDDNKPSQPNTLLQFLI